MCYEYTCKEKLFFDYFELSVRLQAASADFNATTTETFWHDHPLEIGIFALIARRIELGSTNTVAVSSGNFRAFSADWTCFCSHTFISTSFFKSFGHAIMSI